MARIYGFLGTYASPHSRGVYRFTLDTDTGALSPPELIYEAQDAKCLALDGPLLAAPVQMEGRAGALLLDCAGPAPRLLAQALPEARTACHMAFHGGRLYAANYHEGTVMVYAPPSLSPVRRIEIGTGAGCHQVLFHERLLLVPCLELDTVKLFDYTADFAPAGEIPFPRGSGPRHGVFNRDHTRLFLVSERSNELYVYSVKGTTFSLDFVVPIAPEGATAAVRLSQDGRFLYVSTRGIDLLSVFHLDGGAPALLQQRPCGGSHPRDFALSPEGDWLLCLNKDSGSLASFPVDRGAGLLGPSRCSAPVAQGSAIVLTG